MINHQSTRRSRIIPRACRPLHPAKFARCSLRCAPLAASRGKISGALFPRVFHSQAGPPRRGHTRAMAAYHSGPHNLRKKTPGKTPLLPRDAAYGHRLRAGGRAVGAHRPTQPGSAGNRTSAQACAARRALPAPPPWFVHRAPLHRPGPACGRFRGARRWPIKQPAPLRLPWPARAPRLAPSLNQRAPPRGRPCVRIHVLRVDQRATTSSQSSVRHSNAAMRATSCRILRICGSSSAAPR